MKINKLIKLLVTIALGSFVLTGCSKQPQLMGDAGQNVSTTAPMTMGIDRQDFEKAAMDMVDSMLKSGSLNKPDGSRYVVMMSNIVNDTTQRIDTRMLTNKIKRAMRNSGKAIFTNAVGTERDDTTIATRQLRGNDEFDQSTVAGKGTLLSAELGLAGRIMQRSAKTTDGDQLVEYYFQMELTNAKNGLVYWDDESVVGKLGSNDTVTW